MGFFGVGLAGFRGFPGVWGPEKGLWGFYQALGYLSPCCEALCSWIRGFLQQKARTGIPSLGCGTLKLKVSGSGFRALLAGSVNGRTLDCHGQPPVRVWISGECRDAPLQCCAALLQGLGVNGLGFRVQG